MRNAATLKFWKQIGLVGLALNLSAFTAPHKDDLVELSGFLYARSSGMYREQDQNKVYVLKPGTRGQVVETKYFSETKNYGLCLQIKNATDVPADHKCVWVYYDVKKPALNLYSGITDPKTRTQILEAWQKDSKKVTLKKEKSPTKAVAAETTRSVEAVVEKKVETPQAAVAVAPAAAVAKPATTAPSKETAPATKGADSMSPAEEDAKAAAEVAVQTIAGVNKNQQQAMNPSSQCPDGKCNVKIEAYGSCSGSNNYLETPLKAVLNESAYSAFFQTPQKELIRTSCIQRNLMKFGSGRKFQCTPNGTAQAVSAKACVSETYVTLTAKSFNLAADCFGEITENSEQSKKQFALSVFSLMAQESGMHMNVVSPSWAAGSGQMTKGAIEAINERLKGIRSRLDNSKNPNCSQVLKKVLDKPMRSDVLCDHVGAYQDNPLKNMAYSFAYQGVVKQSLDKVFFDNKTYEDIFKDLPAEERTRLEYSLVGWGHNTGPAGLQVPLTAQLRNYVRNNKSLKTSQDVDQFLNELKGFMRTNSYYYKKLGKGKQLSSKTKKRINETANYYSNIQSKMKEITPEPRSCLAN